MPHWPNAVACDRVAHVQALKGQQMKGKTAYINLDAKKVMESEMTRKKSRKSKR